MRSISGNQQILQKLLLLLKNCCSCLKFNSLVKCGFLLHLAFSVIVLLYCKGEYFVTAGSVEVFKTKCSASTLHLNWVFSKSPRAFFFYILFFFFPPFLSYLLPLNVKKLLFRLRVKQTTQLGKLMKSYSERVGVPVSRLRWAGTVAKQMAHQLLLQKQTSVSAIFHQVLTCVQYCGSMEAYLYSDCLCTESTDTLL